MTKLQAILFYLFIFVPLASTAAIPELEKKISQRVQASKVSESALGLVLADEHGEILYQLNGDKQFLPASLTKIFTAAATLEKMPAGHQFVTQILADVSKVKGNTLTGDIYLRGGGDAGFVSESLWFLVNEFKRSQITTIQGDVVVDDSKFDDVRFDLSRDQERVDRAYDAPIGAMTFNWSAINVFVRPSNKPGDQALVFADPESSYIQIKNSTKTVGAGKSTKIEVKHVGYNSKCDCEEILVTGQIAVGANEFVAYKSVTKPEIWAGVQFKEFLKQRGITVQGKVRAGKAGASLKTLASYKSKPIQELVSGMMKFSSNYIAEILTKNLGAEFASPPGTMDKGVQVIRQYVNELGLKGTEIYNPSGLSRKNRTKPKDVLQVLLRMKNNFKVYPEYLSGMPIAGVDGTLKRRLAKDVEGGHVRAKTGHLTGVNGLGGYIGTDDGHVYSFVFLFNGPADDGPRASDLFDRIIVDVVKFGAK